MGLKFKAVIDKNGKIVTEVLDRTAGVLCEKIYNVTNAMGRQVSDEHLDDGCDKVHEIVT